MTEPDLSVVIPAYNSEKTIGEVVTRTRRMASEQSLTCEFVIVDDSSRDGTWSVLKALALEGNDLRVIRFNRNFGQHNALLAGIRAARAPVIVTLDDDLQHPPEEVPKLLARLHEGMDVVYGFPEKLAHGAVRNALSAITKIVLQRAMGADTARHHSGFRAFRTPLRSAFARYDGTYVSIDVLLTWGTNRFAWIPVRHQPREVGRSNYSFGKLINHALTLVTGFSTLPLRIASLAGLGFTAFGGVLLLWVVGRYFIVGRVVPGFAFLGSAISIFSGVQLFALGVMGEYLARVHVRTLGQPSYVVSEAIDGAGAGEGRGPTASDGTRDPSTRGGTRP